MKKYFITGLLTLLPLVLTILIIIFIVDLFTAPFLGFVEGLFLKTGYSIFQKPIIVTILARIIILIFLFFFIIFLGFIGRWFLIRTILNWMNKLFSKIPFVKTIYNITKEVAQAFANKKESKVFKKPVLISFPYKKSYAIGFATGKVPKSCQQNVNDTLVPIFVPTAPHPISGYLIMVKEKDIHDIEITNEEAIKFTVSCGMITPEISKEEVNYDKTK